MEDLGPTDQHDSKRTEVNDAREVRRRSAVLDCTARQLMTVVEEVGPMSIVVALVLLGRTAPGIDLSRVGRGISPTRRWSTRTKGSDRRQVSFSFGSSNGPAFQAESGKNRQGELRISMDAQHIVQIARALDLENADSTLGFARMLAEHCASLAEECPVGASAADAATAIRVAFRLNKAP